jgi:pectin methylesterase-like acyl-CoA thioesterase
LFLLSAAGTAKRNYLPFGPERNHMNIRLILSGLAASAALWATPGTFGAQIFVVNSQTGTIGEYTTSGATVNPALVSGLSLPQGIAVSGGNLGESLSSRLYLAEGFVR